MMPLNSVKFLEVIHIGQVSGTAKTEVIGTLLVLPEEPNKISGTRNENNILGR